MNNSLHIISMLQPRQNHALQISRLPNLPICFTTENCMPIIFFFLLIPLFYSFYFLKYFRLI
jgi:hypothetical protein